MFLNKVQVDGKFRQVKHIRTACQSCCRVPTHEVRERQGRQLCSRVGGASNRVIIALKRRIKSQIAITCEGSSLYK